MLKFTPGPPDEMQILIACGIASFLILFPIVIFLAAVCAEVTHRTRPDDPVAAPRPAPGPEHQRGVVAPAATPREAEVATAV